MADFSNKFSDLAGGDVPAYSPPEAMTKEVFNFIPFFFAIFHNAREDSFTVEPDKTHLSRSYSEQVLDNLSYGQ